MDELYLDNIDEFVNDHNKIVTYKWLSLTLGVHVNTAKQMLFHYLDHKRMESSPQLHATYLVSGKFVDKGQTSHMVSVVREDRLEDIKAKMSLIVSIHVYSVQKALLKDSGPLYSVDYDAFKDNLKDCSRYSAIRCASAVPVEQQQQAREAHRAPSPEPAAKKSGANGESKQSAKPSSKQQKGIMGMFASAKSQEGAKEVKLEQKGDEPVAVAPKSKPAAKSNPAMNFFGNQTTKKPDKAVEEEEAAAAAAAAGSLSATEQRQQSSPPKEKQEDAVAPKEEEEESPPKDVKKDARSKTKRIANSDSEEERMEKKKRRRIKKPQPDSSDEDVIPDSPQQKETREPSPPPPMEVEPVSHSHQTLPGAKTRKRRRVLKSRTFVDDEGCIVTEKGYESESYSEAEDDTKAAKRRPTDFIPAKQPTSSREEERKKSQKKTSANASKGTKQASIMGFFQKK